MNWHIRLTTARTAKNIRKSALAKMVGVSAPTVTDWENKETGMIKGANLMKVCVALDISPEWLITGEGPMERQDTKPAPTLAESLRLRVETDAELRLLTLYRVGDEADRLLIDGILDQIQERIAPSARQQGG